MLEEEQVMRIYHPITRVELDPDSIQYQTMYHFLNNEVHGASTNEGALGAQQLQQQLLIVSARCT